MKTPTSIRNTPSIAPEKIVDFDFFGVKAVDGDLHKGWKKLHDGPDVFFTPKNGGHWVMTRADDIEKVFQDSVRFSNKGVAMTTEPREMFLAPGEIDPPRHTSYRMLLNPFFGPKPISVLESKARILAHGLIKGFRDSGQCEFRQAFAQVMPIYVFLTFMNLPTEDASALLPAADLLTRDPDHESFLQAMNTMMGYLSERIDERLRSPQQDIISRLLKSEIDGLPLTKTEVLSLASNVMFGGLDTVVGSMQFFMNFLARNPAHRKQLQENPTLIGEAIEELLRRHPVANFGRMATVDMDDFGVPIRAGDLILLPTVLFNLD
jgi:cytochrome P450